MPNTYSDNTSKVFKKLTAEIDPTSGVYVAGMRIFEGLIEEVYIKSIDNITYNEHKESYAYGYAFGDANDYDVEYFTTVNASNPEFVTS
jgi:hypothetical protein